MTDLEKLEKLAQAVSKLADDQAYILRVLTSDDLKDSDKAHAESLSEQSEKLADEIRGLY